MSFATEIVVVAPTLPARSVELALMVSVPSPRPETLTPVNVIVPAPAGPAFVALTLPPFDTVSRTTSVVSEPAGKVTEMDKLPALPPLT